MASLLYTTRRRPLSSLLHASSPDEGALPGGWSNPLRALHLKRYTAAGHLHSQSTRLKPGAQA